MMKTGVGLELVLRLVLLPTERVEVDLVLLVLLLFLTSGTSISGNNSDDSRDNPDWIIRNARFAKASTSAGWKPLCISALSSSNQARFSVSSSVFSALTFVNNSLIIGCRPC